VNRLRPCNVQSVDFRLFLHQSPASVALAGSVIVKIAIVILYVYSLLLSTIFKMEPGSMVRPVEHKMEICAVIAGPSVSDLAPFWPPVFPAPFQCLLPAFPVTRKLHPEFVILDLDHRPVPRTVPPVSCSVPTPVSRPRIFPISQDPVPVFPDVFLCAPGFPVYCALRS